MSMEVQGDAVQKFDTELDKFRDNLIGFVGRSFSDLISGILSGEYKSYTSYTPLDERLEDTATNQNANTSTENREGGERTLAELVTKSDGTEYKTDSFDISSQNEVLKLFDDTAKAHGVEYALMRGEFGKTDPDLPEQCSIIFRKADTDKMMDVFKEFAEKETARQEGKHAVNDEKGRDGRGNPEKSDKDSGEEKKGDTPKEEQKTSRPVAVKKKKKLPTWKEKKAQVDRKKAEADQDTQQKEKRKDKGAR